MITTFGMYDSESVEHPPGIINIPLEPTPGCQLILKIALIQRLFTFGACQEEVGT